VVVATFWLEPEKSRGWSLLLVGAIELGSWSLRNLGGWSLLLVGARELEVGASLNVIL
jgi:hypothetical protein